MTRAAGVMAQQASAALAAAEAEMLRRLREQEGLMTVQPAAAPAEVAITGFSRFDSSKAKGVVVADAVAMAAVQRQQRLEQGGHAAVESAVEHARQRERVALMEKARLERLEAAAAIQLHRAKKQEMEWESWAVQIFREWKQESGLLTTPESQGAEACDEFVL